MRRPMPKLNPYDEEGHVRPLEHILNDAVRHALIRNEGQVAPTARELGISRSSLYRMLRRIEPPPAPAPAECGPAVSVSNIEHWPAVIDW